MMNDGDSYMTRVCAIDAMGEVVREMTRPSVLHRPQLMQRCAWRDDTTNHWSAIYGSIMGVGASPEEAMANFDKAWTEKLPEPTPINGQLGKGETL